MDRRAFLTTSLGLAGLTAAAGRVGAQNPEPTLDAIESPRLTLIPRSSDQWELEFRPSRPLRILQVTDTHFSSTPAKDQRTVRDLQALIHTTDPDLIVHTGDFVNNDSRSPVRWDGVAYFNGCGRPWALCFGNHDYPVAQAPGSRSLEDFRTSLRNCAMGFADIAGKRSYCYRHDLRGRGAAPTATLCYFQVGYAEGDRKISDPQLRWFDDQMKADQKRGWNGPILVFVHIPLIEYDLLLKSGRVVEGVKNEDVCYDSDSGASFRAFAASRRVVGVFCGHDHVNNYYGPWQGINLHYGRVSGWGGYGDWARGGRLIALDPATGRFTQREVIV
jgi:3',5'-cyclic AMP phosphodiesterase CpdA